MMTTLSATGSNFRINEKAWSMLEKQELTNLFESLSIWIDCNEENMTTKQFNQAMEIKNKLENFINSKR